jgi:hypothetical protein
VAACLKVDQVRTYDALARARHVLFGHAADDPPPWLETAWAVMGMDARELKAAKQRAEAAGQTRLDAPFKEFVSRHSHFEEFGSPVLADHYTTNDPALNSLLLKAF